MISRFEYSFQANFLPNDIEQFTNRFGLWYALNNSNAVWARIPLHDFSVPNQEAPFGAGDMDLGWGYLVHENLSSRLTTVAASLEARLPSGDFSKGTGLDTYIIRSSGLLGLNPTDLFPVYILGRYLHSTGNLGGNQRDEPDSPVVDRRVRSIELTILSFRILPKGIFLTAAPSFFFNLNRDFNLFSLGVGVGRALNRRLSIEAGYVQHVAGRQTFNRGFTIGLKYLWGKEKAQR